MNIRDPRIAEPELHAVLVTFRRQVGSFLARDSRVALEHTDVEVFRGTWHEAQAVWQVLDDSRIAGDLPLDDLPVAYSVNSFAVRSIDDPRVTAAIAARQARAGRDPFAVTVRRLGTSAQTTMRVYRRKALGEIALRAVKNPALTTLGAVVRRAIEDARCAGLNPAQHDVEQAVKDRVLIARDWNNDRRAYFTPRRKGLTIRDMAAAAGSDLRQTSLALRANFARLDA